MERKTDNLLGYCGLYCGNCLYYKNTVKGTGTVHRDGAMVFCEGCNSSVNTPHCSECNIKSCNKEKGFRYCIVCKDFPCSIMTEFIEDTRFPYHKEVPDTMKRLNEIDLETWADEMQARYTCGKCGKEFTYFDAKCTECQD